MGIATELETSMDHLLNNYITAKSAAFCSMLIPVALTGATIYIFTMGWAIMRGEASDPLHTAIMKFFKIAIIAGIALVPGEYQSKVVESVQGIQGAMIQGFSGAATIGGMVDDMAKPFDELGRELMSLATLDAYFPDLSLLAAAAIVSLAEAFLFVVGLGLYMLAKVGLTLVLATGPVFILCAMFPATQKFTESWIGQALSFVFLNALIAGCISMLTSFASQFAGEIHAKVGTTAIIKDTLSLLIVSVSLGVVMLNLNTLASALGGGASISGIGRDIGRGAMKLLSKKSKPEPKPEGGEIKPQGQDGGGRGGRRDGAYNPGGQEGGGSGGSRPLYQRNVLENIRRAA